MAAARIYVGNLPLDVRERELEDLFHKVGARRSLGIRTGGGRQAGMRCSFDCAYVAGLDVHTSFVCSTEWLQL